MEINIAAVAVAMVANFIFGFLWFTPLFGKAWAKEMGYPDDMKAEKSDMIRGMLYMVVGNFLMAYVFAHNMEAWKFVPDMDEMSGLSSAMMASLFTWLGFYLPNDLGNTVWAKHSWKLFAINTAYHFLCLVIAAMIITFWPA